MRWIAAWFLIACSSGAATITAVDPGPVAVSNALNAASAGDTVSIPAGTSNWTYGLSWTAPANVTVKGAGTTATGGGDQTVILANAPDQGTMLNIDASAGGFRLSGITFRSTTNQPNYKYVVTITGGPLRVDHCHFQLTNLNYRIGMVNGAFGVMDHNWYSFKGGGSTIFCLNGRRVGTDQAGDYEWAQHTEFGSTNYLYVEDSVITATPTSTAYDGRMFDGYTGAKIVVRFNTFTNANTGETHATGHAGDDRGLRSMEIYGNQCYTSDPPSPIGSVDPGFAFNGLYSGTALIWGNRYDQCFKNGIRLQVVRSDDTTYPQTATPNGWGYAGTDFNGTGSNWDKNDDVGTGYPCLDQPGRGYGAMLTNVFPNKINFSTGTIAWPTQALEPVYIWDDSGTLVSGWGGATFSDGSGGRVAPNRDYYPGTNSFDGTVGTGWGSLASRPATCTPGVAYWAIDQGDWNTSASNPYGVQQNGADGVLYVATAPDTWTLYYTPYTYPHPLNVSEASLSPGRRKPRGHVKIKLESAPALTGPWFSLWSTTLEVADAYLENHFLRGVVQLETDQ